jgi:hypothetical protein
VAVVGVAVQLEEEEEEEEEADEFHSRQRPEQANS